MQFSAKNLLGITRKYDEQEKRKAVDKETKEVMSGATKEVAPLATPEGVMEASRVTISPQTMHMNKKMSLTKRMELVEQRVIAVIQSKPAGTPLSYNDFMEATESTYSNTWSKISNMVRDGKIGRVELDGKIKGYSYFIPVPGESIKTETVTPVLVEEVPTQDAPVLAAKGSTDTPAVIPEATTEEKPVEEVTQPVTVIRMSEADIKASIVEDLAKSYFWETSGDSLHKFVEWVKEQGAHE